MADFQQSIIQSVSVDGLGLHTGQKGRLTFHPARENHGIVFRRVDLENEPLIRADVDCVVDTSRGTTLKENGASVYTIEHVLAACTGLGIDNLLIDLDMDEIPIKDGSSRYFIEALMQAGIHVQEAEKEYIIIDKPICWEKEELGIKLEALPAEKLKIDVTIDYNSPVLKKQKASLYDISDFKDQIASCRTFVFLHELEFLLAQNLIKGGDLSNAIVFVNRSVSQSELDRLAKLFAKPKVQVKKEGILNNLSLHFENEPARHKLLDVIGDLSLLGKPIKGHIKALRPGHMANTEFAKTIRKQFQNNFT